MPNARIALWFAAVLALSLASRWRLFHANAERCALDGVRIVPIYQVDLMRGNDRLARFCSLRCAEEWPEVAADTTWLVRDEVTGLALDTTKACFVESDVVTIAARQERRHVFSDWANAHSHLSEFHGRRIPNPLSPARDQP